MFLRLIPGEAEMCYSARKRFSAVGTIAVTALVASGAINAAYQIDLDQRGWSPPNLYESLLLQKHIFVGGILMLAKINHFLLTPRSVSHGALDPGA